MRKSNNVTKNAVDKNRSPLVKLSQVKIPFTEVPTKIQQKTEFTAYMNNLLSSIGLMDETVIDLDGDQSSVNNLLRAASPPPPPQISNRGPREATFEPTQRKLVPHLTIAVQTESFKCNDCEARKKVVYKNVGTSCGDDNMTYSVSTQVTEDDFYSSSNRIPKNQSLASLTPAQLLATSTSSRRYPEDDTYMSKSLFSGTRSFSKITEFIPPPKMPSAVEARFMPADLGERDIPPPPSYSGFGSTRGRGSQNDDPRFSFY